MRASIFPRLRRQCALVLLLACGTAALAAASSIELVSRVDPGALSDTAAGAGGPFVYPPSISRDGRYVAFLSAANNLAPGQVDLSVGSGQRGRLEAVRGGGRRAPLAARQDHAPGGPVIEEEGAAGRGLARHQVWRGC